MHESRDAAVHLSLSVIPGPLYARTLGCRDAGMLLSALCRQLSSAPWTFDPKPFLPTDWEKNQKIADFPCLAINAIGV